ncbi:helix-turn-helix domain-containing protein [Brevundimonas sp.]|uniref:helix-turn-helix domain-containing protein n=1 Tax=Brevundimonas sp. TaxID=1871086 RepID=UPI002E0EC57A|nr:helix-turn-helix domain-containing protein [Brevundimonas sp.]
MTDPFENAYRYTECGLDNVFLRDLPVCKDMAGEETISIPYINQLHQVIRLGLALKETGLDPKELRFLRSELGMTQAELADILHKDAQTVGRWERGETPIDSGLETLVRLMTLESLGQDASVKEIAGKSVSSASPAPHIIDASDPKNYRLLAA